MNLLKKNYKTKKITYKNGKIHCDNKILQFKEVIANALFKQNKTLLFRFL